MSIAGFSDSKILRANAKQLANNVFKFAPQRTVLERDGKKIEVRFFFFTIILVRKRIVSIEIAGL